MEEIRNILAILDNGDGNKNVMITHHDTLAEGESVNKILID